MTKRTATTRQPATENEALAGLLGIWNRHRTHGFAPNLRGPGASALMLATRKGWLWNSGQATFLTLAGVQALGEFLGRDLIAEQAAHGCPRVCGYRPAHFRTPGPSHGGSGMSALDDCADKLPEFPHNPTMAQRVAREIARAMLALRCGEAGILPPLTDQAEAVLDAGSSYLWPHYLPVALAAIAEMREPSAAMQDACNSLGASREQSGEPVMIEDYWHAMIDAAIAEGRE